MAFSRKFATLIEESNRILTDISFNNGIELIIPNSKKFKLNNIKNSFATSYFDINDEDNIYGVILDSHNSLSFICINDNFISKSRLFSFDSEKYRIDFPYIKRIDNKTHVFFYLVNIRKPNTCSLIHYYNDGTIWNKHTLANINYFILTNFVVIWDSNFPSILYLNKINDYEEVILSLFDPNTNSWCHPMQITNSGCTKVYLSAIKDNLNYYHVVYSENNDDKYYCNYTSGYIKDNVFNIYSENILKECIACEFPSLSLINDSLYCQWLEYDNLYTSSSNDNGITWGKPKLFNCDRDEYFTRYSYKCNKNIKYNFILDNFFSFNTDFRPLGFDTNILKL